MAFKQTPPPPSVPDSPEKLFLDLPRRKVPGLLVHQGEMLKAYARDALTAKDVALQLPTGSGKTLVGLLLAEWRRRKFHERVLYLCPTNQLVHQVVEQADEKYGLSVLGFTGSKDNYDTAAKSAYRTGERVAVTNYSSLFNSNPYFSDPDVVIIDDAHVAENYIAQMWSLRVERFVGEHKALYAALTSILKPLISAQSYARMIGAWEGVNDKFWIDKLPSPTFVSIEDELVATIDAHVGDLNLKFPWQLIRENLHGCQLYIAASEILIRPLIPPTWTHDPFEQAKQRVYMSATLGAGGDLERLTGRTTIKRLPIPEGWDRQGIGRRFFIFPGMSLGGDDEVDLRSRLMKEAGRSVVLVPSDSARQRIADEVGGALGYKIFSASDIEKTKKDFIAENSAVAIMASRYDGIDFPGNDCRLLFIDGLPRATNLQERFLMERMGCSVLFNERVQTRVLQAIGRCTRGLEDYSAVVVSGEELSSYLADNRRRAFFHPELQAELSFGVEQSSGTTADNLIDNFKIFHENSKGWEDENRGIIAKRDAAEQVMFPALDNLETAVKHEIEFQRTLWQGDYEVALASAKGVLARLDAPELRGYRALWHYLAGSAARLGASKGIGGLDSQARAQFRSAKEAVKSIPWLVELSQFQSGDDNEAVQNKYVMLQIERLEIVLSELGTHHDRKYEKKERDILSGIEDAARFENAQLQLGEMLGFSVGKVEADASPDPWWIIGDICFVFEDHAGAGEKAVIDATKARQAASHPAWIKANVAEANGASILPVLVTAASTAKTGAIPHLKDVALWPLAEYRDWARTALQTVREVRGTFSVGGDIVWRIQAAERFEAAGIDASSIFQRLKRQIASDLLIPEG